MVKENDGKQWWNRRRRRIGVITLVILSLCLAFLRVVIPRMARFHSGRNAKSIKVTGLSQNKGGIIYDLHHPQERAILEAKYFLTEIDISFGALSDKAGFNKTHYGSVSATFCPLDWTLQKTNPSSVPMFRVLVGASKHCSPNRVTVDLREIVRKARAYDLERSKKGGVPEAAVVTKPLKLGGVAFHESRCGSTLVSNLLVACNPTAHRVYSESAPPITALRACSKDSENCRRSRQITLLRDVIYIMSRSQAASRETHVFFKIQSVGIQFIDVFTQAFPATPWVFVYRDPVEVLMSHLKHGGDAAKRAVCLRSHDRPPPMLRDLVAEHSSKDVSELSTVEFCAAHLATLCAAALKEYNKEHSSGADAALGRMINYASLPDIMWESILPNHFDLGTNEVREEEVERMKNVAGIYSKGFQNSDKANKKWEPDSEHKQDGASGAMRKAADLFLKRYYEDLEATNRNGNADDDAEKDEKSKEQ